MNPVTSRCKLRKLEIKDVALNKIWQIELSENGSAGLQKSQFAELEEHFYYEKDEKRVFRHGECKAFYSNGKLASQSHYKKGKLHGLACYFSRQGQTLSQSLFIEGKRCGPFKRWYVSGQLYSSGSYDQDRPVGTHLYYYESGALRTEICYTLGKSEQVAWQYYEDGSVRRKTHYLDGKRHGSDTMWRANGFKSFEALYEKGLPCGELFFFHDNGKIAEHYEYLDLPWKFNVRRQTREGLIYEEGRTLADGSYEQKHYDAKGALIKHILVKRSSSGKTLSYTNLLLVP